MGRIRRVRAYVGRLTDLVRSLDLEWWQPESDKVLSDDFRAEYQAIADLLTPSFDIRNLRPDCRHRFFIATDPVSHPADPQKKLPGLSQLEGLLGYEYQARKKEDAPGPPTVSLTTGDQDLDLIAQAVLVFESSAGWVIDRFDAKSVSKLIEFACDLKQGDEALKRKQQASDRAWWDAHEEQIMGRVQAMGGVPGVVSGKVINQQNAKASDRKPDRPP